MAPPPSDSAGPILRRADIAVVGAGIVGLFVGLLAARGGMRCAVIDRGRAGGVASRRSGALIRTHYAHPLSARLAIEGREVFANWREIIGGDAGFRRCGFVYLPRPEEVATGALRRQVEMLRGMGSDAEIVDERQLSEFAPRFRTSDVAAAVIEPGSGFADPGAALQSLVRAAVDAGVRVIPDEGVERLEVVGGRVVGVTTGAGRRLACDLVAVCAGAWSAGLVAPIGLELPIRPTAALPARFVGTGDPGPVAIDAPNGVYLRPWARGGSMAGLRDWSTRDLQGPDGPLPEVDAAFAARTLRGVGRRVRGAARGRFVGGDPGPLDMTPDGRPLLGPTALPGLWLSCGWSGTGFKTAPAAARALVDWMRGDTPPYPELAPVGAGAPTGSGQQDPTMR